jgi:hypothetical protein
MNMKFDEFPASLAQTSTRYAVLKKRGSERNRLIPKACVSGWGWFLVLWSLVFSVPSYAVTKVNVSNFITGLSTANRAISINSNGYPIVEATCETNATGTTWFGATHGEAMAFGQAEVGRLRVKAATESDSTLYSNAGAGSVSQATAYSYWNDNFTISSSSQPPGQLGEMTVLVFITGDMTLQCDYPQSSVYFRLSVRVYDSYGADTNFAGGTQTKIALDGTVQTLAMDGALVGPGLWPVRCQFHFGRPTYVTAWAEVFADARASATNVSQGTVGGYASSDFSHSVIWGGITNVRGSGGASVTNFTITSDSGYDYLFGTVTNSPVITRIQFLPQGLALDWSDLGLRAYTVESSPTLSPGNWSPASGVAWPIQTNSVLLPPSVPSPTFFRIKVQ